MREWEGSNVPRNRESKEEKGTLTKAARRTCTTGRLFLVASVSCYQLQQQDLSAFYSYNIINTASVSLTPNLKCHQALPGITSLCHFKLTGLTSSALYWQYPLLFFSGHKHWLIQQTKAMPRAEGSTAPIFCSTAGGGGVFVLSSVDAVTCRAHP